MTYEEAFHILGLEWSDKLTEEDIKRAYRNKVKQDHPDQGGDEAELQKDKEAYEFLKSNGIKPQNGPDTTNRTSTMDAIVVKQWRSKTITSKILKNICRRKIGSRHLRMDR